MAKPAFKHMGPRDVALFAAFALTEQARAFDKWQFDARVAQGRCPPSFIDPVQRNGMFLLTQLRIDAIGWQGHQPTLIEVKPETHLSAFGQIQAYEWFYTREVGIVPRKMIISDACSDDMRTLYAAFNIDLVCLSPATLGDINLARRLVAPKTLRSDYTP